MGRATNDSHLKLQARRVWYFAIIMREIYMRFCNSVLCPSVSVSLLILLNGESILWENPPTFPFFSPHHGAPRRKAYTESDWFERKTSLSDYGYLMVSGVKGGSPNDSVSFSAKSSLFCRNLFRLKTNFYFLHRWKRSKIWRNNLAVYLEVIRNNRSLLTSTWQKNR